MLKIILTPNIINEEYFRTSITGGVKEGSFFIKK
jgi:hypothetical protein